MKTRSMLYLVLAIFLSGVLLIQTTNAAPKKGTLRVSGDNTWTAFIDGEEVAQSGNWQAPTVSEFTLKNGFAQIAVYVHDAEPGACRAEVGSSPILSLTLSLTISEQVKTAGDAIPVNLSPIGMMVGKKLTSTTASGKTNSKSTKNSEKVSGGSVLHRCAKFSKTQIVKPIGSGAVPTMLKTISISGIRSAHFPSNRKANSPLRGRVLKTRLSNPVNRGRLIVNFRVRLAAMLTNATIHNT